MLVACPPLPPAVPFQAESCRGRGAARNLCEAIINGRLCARLYASSMMGDESERMTLPIDMKNLGSPISESRSWVKPGRSYPNVAPEPSIYCPSVLMIPLGPAPYLKMLTVPVRLC